MKRLIITEVPYIGDIVVLGKPTVFKGYLFTDEETEGLKEVQISSLLGVEDHDLEFIKLHPEGKLYKIPGIFEKREDIVDIIDLLRD